MREDIFCEGMAVIPRYRVILVAPFLILAFFLGKGNCDSVCPSGITNVTGTTSGKLVYPSSGTYGVNETKCWRIQVPKPYKGLTIFVQSFEIEECKNCNCDNLKLESRYSSLYHSDAICGRGLSMHQECVDMRLGNRPQVQRNGENIWIRFVSDDTVHYKGFNLSYIVESDATSFTNQKSYLNASEDETISFGTPKVGIKKYPADFEWQWFLIVPEGRKIRITFDTFELEQSKDCENDYLEIREAYFKYPCRGSSDLEEVYGAILSKPVCGTNQPTTIQSAGNMVWVHFRSDDNTTTTYKGFKASFTSGEGRLSISHLLTLLFISALLFTASKETVF